MAMLQGNDCVRTLSEGTLSTVLEKRVIYFDGLGADCVATARIEIDLINGQVTGATLYTSGLGLAPIRKPDAFLARWALAKIGRERGVVWTKLKR